MAGANIIGGCCRILPSHIAAMKKVHDKIGNSQYVDEVKVKNYSIKQDYHISDLPMARM